MSTLLDIQDLAINFKTRSGDVHAVDGVSFQLEAGKVLGIAGESGCGKTTTALSIPRLLPSNARLVRGHILFDGVDLMQFSEGEIEKIRWKQISMVFQGAMNALNPVKTIGAQIIEPIVWHEPAIARGDANQRVLELLERVGIPAARARSYPHEFSGGMRQRVMIAMALACRPKLIISDEPVTALDVMIQAQILNLLKDLQKQMNLAMIFISHDLSVIAESCDEIAIMYAGKLVERGSIRKVFSQPAHPYTQALIRSFPNIYGKQELIHGIPGYPPNLIHPPTGCRFHERCDRCIDICAQSEPVLREVGEGQIAACHRIGETLP
ncbi:MAG: ABC transporter ATP-binding protein [Chloroflexi bacterium]|nr:ABC transporter ATP-binding protein [Chloroflexota bacterium]